jgi:hypothetical protein
VLTGHFEIKSRSEGHRNRANFMTKEAMIVAVIDDIADARNTITVCDFLCPFPRFQIMY